MGIDYKLVKRFEVFLKLWMHVEFNGCQKEGECLTKKKKKREEHFWQKSGLEGRMII